MTTPQPAGRVLRRDALANRERVLAAAVAAVLREGRQVSMSTIAAEAGVGIGTLYRRYPHRDALLSALTERSSCMVLDVAETVEDRDGPALAALDAFLDRTIDHRDQLVLPLHGGPATLSPLAARTRAAVHRSLERVVERGHRDGSVGTGTTAADVITFGAMLAQPLTGTGRDATARRQKDIILRGVAALPSRGPAASPEEQR